jgi:hypothetical protein
VQTFLIQLNNFVDFYSLSERQSVAYLKQSLIGSAAQVLWNLKSNSSMAEIISELHKHFGQQTATERYRQLLKNKRQGRNETLDQLYLEILSLSKRAFPNENGSLFQIIQRDYYVEAIADISLKQKLMESDFPTISDAHTAALRLKAIFDCTESYDKRAVRQVQSNKTDNTENQIRQLQNQVRELTKSIQKMTNTAVGAPHRQDSRGAPKSTKVCYYCRNAGHLIRDCQKKREDERHKTDQSRDDKEQAVTDSRVNTVDQLPANQQSAQYVDIVLLSPHDVSKKYKGGKRNKSFATTALIDSGADYTIVSTEFEKYCVGKTTQSTKKLFTASHQPLEISAEGKIRFTIAGRTFSASVVFSPDINNFILGAEWLTQQRCILRMAERDMLIGNLRVVLRTKPHDSEVRRICAAADITIPANTIVFA